MSISKKKKNVFYGGDTPQGTIRLCVNKGTIQVGEVGYTALRGHNSNEGRSFHQTFLNEIYQSNEEMNVFMRGEYCWVFEIKLPDNCLPSLGQPHLYPNIRYYLQGMIGGHVFGPENKPQQRNGKGLVVKGFIQKSAFVPGETIEGTIKIENPDLAIGIMPEITHWKGTNIIQPIQFLIPYTPLTPSFLLTGFTAESHAFTSQHPTKLLGTLNYEEISFHENDSF
ncbi:hypothetical protein I4U23_022218 [Adineta vaga]|nr:hypothetical protein I4U23_022218 [Adineta vaga]